MFIVTVTNPEKTQRKLPKNKNKNNFSMDSLEQYLSNELNKEKYEFEQILKQARQEVCASYQGD
ncbi:hypothetical protein ABEY52_26805 [Priestia aryabhattai]|uniref:hypothetical protein n=1 Tax=Priestia aryabhattai TaxID=412384 RepID=UPI003D2E5DA2